MAKVGPAPRLGTRENHNRQDLLIYGNDQLRLGHDCFPRQALDNESFLSGCLR